MNIRISSSLSARRAALLALALAAPVTAQAQHGGHPGGDHGHGVAGPGAAAAAELPGATHATVRWNAIARAVAPAAGGHGPAGDAHGTYAAHPMGGRTLAILSVAQLAALEAAPDAADSPFAVATASAHVLGTLNPDARATVHAHLEQERGRARPSGQDLAAAEARGRAAAEQALARAAADGYDGHWSGTLRAGASHWISAPAGEPIGTHWGGVRPWIVTSNQEFRPGAPPAPGTPEFDAALDEVRQVTRGLTADQTALALRWMHPVDGYWNEVAAELIEAEGIDEARSARILTLTNVAVTDAVITCFDTKYHYQYPRPSHVDATIPMAVMLPNHPSYVSGHACVSGAASEVLAHFFPAEADRLRATADEIALSRLYAGVHYRFDNDTGVEIGRAIARSAVETNPSAAELLSR